jgi:hypothetical protein
MDFEVLRQNDSAEYGFNCRTIKMFAHLLERYVTTRIRPQSPLISRACFVLLRRSTSIRRALFSRIQGDTYDMVNQG